MTNEPGEKAIKQLNERFRREAQENKEKTIGWVVYTQIQIHGEVSYETIRKQLVEMMASSILPNTAWGSCADAFMLPP